jgi:hypothetical protein
MKDKVVEPNFQKRSQRLDLTFAMLGRCCGARVMLSAAAMVILSTSPAWPSSVGRLGSMSSVSFPPWTIEFA